MKLIVFCLFCCFFSQTSAQSSLVSEPLNIRNDYGYEIIGRLKEHILLFRDRFDEFEIQSYDARFQLSWHKEIALEKRSVQVLAVVAGKNDFSVIYRARRKNEWLLRLHKYDAEAEMVDSITLKKWPTGLFSTPNLEIVKSEDQNYLAVFDLNTEDNNMPITCLRLDKMQLVWDKKLVMETGFLDKESANVCLSNSGDFYISTDENNRKQELSTHKLCVHRVGNDAAGSYWEIPAPEFVTRDTRFSFDEKNQRLVGGGFFNEKNSERSLGYFFTFIDPTQSTVQKIRFEPFDAAFLSIFKGKEVAKSDPKTLTDLHLRHLFFREDGGVIFTGEQNYELMRGSLSGRTGWRGEAPRTIIDHFYEDFFLIATTSDGAPIWKTVLHKKQESQDDDAIFSSFLPFKTANRLRFLFNDEIRYENTCSEYVLDPAGHYDRNSLLNTAEQGLRLRFRDGLQISAHEAIVPSEFRGKLRLVLFQF